MGCQLSKVNFSSIANVENIKSPNNTKSSKLIYKITYQNGRQQTIKLSSKQDAKFHLRYKYSKMVSPIKNINYAQINNITNIKYINNTNETKSLTNEDQIISFTLIFNDGSKLNQQFNYLENTVFIAYLKSLNLKIFKEYGYKIGSVLI